MLYLGPAALKFTIKLLFEHVVLVYELQRQYQS